MNIKNRQKLASGIVYTMLGVVIAAVTAAAVIGLISGNRAKKELDTPYADPKNQNDSSEKSYGLPFRNEETSEDVITVPDDGLKNKSGKTAVNDMKPEPEPEEKKPVQKTNTIPDIQHENISSGNDENSGTADGNRSSAAFSDTASGSSESLASEFVRPCSGEISKDYSDDVLVYSFTMNDYRIHSGIDFASPVGTPVCACAAGVISEIYDNPFMGKTIVIDHGNGLSSYYMNLSPDIPKEISAGTKVNPGDIIAGIGETSASECADSPHLHMEMTLNGNNVNPHDYIKDLK